MRTLYTIYIIIFIRVCKLCKREFKSNAKWYKNLFCSSRQNFDDSIILSFVTCYCFVIC